MGQNKKQIRQWLVISKSSHKLILFALLLIALSQSKVHYIDRSEAEASNDVSESEVAEQVTLDHDKHWNTATTEEIEPHGDADEEELTSIKDRLEKHLSMQAGIPVNLETADQKQQKKKHKKTVQVVNSTTGENEEDESSTDSETLGDDQQPVDQNDKRKGKNHLKHHQRIVGHGIHQEVWNEEAKEYESSFKAYVRQQSTKDDDKGMFEFETYGEDKELVMTRNNSKVFMTLCICALIGGIVAGFIIRYLMRKFFPEDKVETSPIISQSQPNSGKLSKHSRESSKISYETTKDSFQTKNSTVSNMELV